MQLWTRGLAQESGGDAAIQGVLGESLEDYGIDWSGPVPAETDSEIVEIPVTQNPLTPQQMDDLVQAVDPLEQCDDLGVSLYMMARTFVNECI